jgi:quinol monooxygenase YgiN
MGSAERAHVVAVTEIHGIAGRRDELRELMRDTQARVAAEPGCLVYRFSATLEDPDEYVHIQEWESEAAFADHQRSPAFREYQSALFDLLARPSDMRLHYVRQSVAPQPSVVDPRSFD